MVGGDWRLAAGGFAGWRLAVGGWRWLAAVGGSWQLVMGGWWRLAAVDGWRLVAVGGWWQLAVSGWWSLGAALKGGPSQKKIWSLKDRPGSAPPRSIGCRMPHCMSISVTGATQAWLAFSPDGLSACLSGACLDRSWGPHLGQNLWGVGGSGDLYSCTPAPCCTLQSHAG